MLVRLQAGTQEARLAAVLRERGLWPGRFRFFTTESGPCLALLGLARETTDQFLRSIIYALQESCGEEMPFPEIVETRLVPASFDLFPAEGSDASMMVGMQGGGNLLARYDLHLDSCFSFGSGLHPSTRLAIALIEAARDPALDFVERVLDVGCGSGILALLCARLGARSVLALDRDSEAVEAARRNIAANNLEMIVRVADTPVAEVQCGFDLVVANLAISVLYGLLGELCRLVAGHGRLVLSGFQRGQGERLCGQVTGKGFHLLEERAEEGWHALLFRREGK